MPSAPSAITTVISPHLPGVPWIVGPKLSVVDEEVAEMTTLRRVVLMALTLVAGAVIPAPAASAGAAAAKGGPAKPKKPLKGGL